ncbi:hypothetical protein CONPUDRAFT_162213 [Coniophora puteana RWD-64-598 SS2]|uniref:EH domain-containing protein n=1 Tax=Coniophora puteana (strain RWD-64-598) TaxID=741705 RepID=A0A5M3N1Y2_CONPW|nr:uncharacterized protein CONPUDRAFT_162213 [Coniophora puteana RWD-64-598 SS2]EIW84891.1 hypothetical protein CONPUDRAFT_162213 [Coniophora puteana RWD-64-598 SS2]
MPSAAIQSRIKAFEALSAPSTSDTDGSSQPATQVTKTTVPDSSSLLETPISPTAQTYRPIAPLTVPRSSSRSPSPSPPNLGRKSSLIDLKDWVVDDGPKNDSARNGSTGVNSLRTNINGSSTPLINLESAPKSRPPLPPRKPSYTSIKSTSSSPSGSGGLGATLKPPPIAGSRPVEHTYPPTNGNEGFGTSRKGHAPTSSISSFHSVSLSDGGTIDSIPSAVSLSREANASTDADSASLDESFENVSASSAVSPGAASRHFDWGNATVRPADPRPVPPRLPQRPGPPKSPVSGSPKSPLPPSSPVLSPPRSVSRSGSASSTSTSVPTITTRRPPPPPPSHVSNLNRTKPPSSRGSLNSGPGTASASDRSSIQSQSTGTSTSRTSVSTRSSIGKSTKLSRPTPVPPAARARYETVFNTNVLARRKVEKSVARLSSGSASSSSPRKTRQAAGWRGLSVDLITDPNVGDKAKEEEKDGADVDAIVGPEERLNGRIVRLIWNASMLEQSKLRDVWAECNPDSTGSIDRDSFVRGMWRIDEELRKAHLQGRTTALSAASSARLPFRPKPVLR